MMNTVQELLIEHTSQFNNKLTLGSNIIGTVLPTVLFVVYFWCLSETYILTTFMNPAVRRRRRNIPKNRLWKFFLVKTLTLILVWSGGQCWSGGLLRFLNAYTLIFLTTLNDCLKPSYRINQSVVLSIEYILNTVICYSVVALIRHCYEHLISNYNYEQRRTRIYRLRGWHNLLPIRDEISELGENGYLLMRNPIHPTQNIQVLMENSNAVRLGHTQSCPLTSKKTRIVKRRKQRRKSL